MKGCENTNKFIYKYADILTVVKRGGKIYTEYMYKELNGMIDALTGTIPISMFNRGLAGKIFEEVKKAGAKVVMKNNVPECVLLSPEEYTALIDAVNDAKLLSMANERLAKLDESKIVTEAEHKQKNGITSETLAGYEEVEFE